MRTTLLGGLLDAARHNLARDADRVAIFESARAYLRDAAPATGGQLEGRFAGRLAAPAHEPHRVAALLVGELAPALVGAACKRCRRAGLLRAQGHDRGSRRPARRGARAGGGAPQPFLHPGRAAEVAIGGSPAGWLGELHPLVARAWDLPAAAAFELDLAPLVAASRLGEERFEDVTTFPAVLQDLAVTVPDEVPAERVRAAVGEGGGELLVGAEVFDLYRGEQLGAGRKSLALRLEFRAPDRTLTDAEVGELRDRIRAELDRIGGSLRE